MVGSSEASRRLGRWREIVRVLVTGAQGLVGTRVVRRFQRNETHEVLGLGHVALDVTSRDAVLSTITTFQPDLIVHAAAMTGVDDCEARPEAAFVANALAVRYVVDGATRVDARVVHLSTDFVFDGLQRRPYVEWDRPNPLSIYGLSKLGGEQELRETDTCIRTSWVFGGPDEGFVATVLRLAQRAESSGETLSFVGDQMSVPTFAGDLAELIYDLGVGYVPGMYHATNEGATSRAGFARDILRAAGKDDRVIRDVAAESVRERFPAPRPVYSVLDGLALRALGCPEPRPYAKALAEVFA